MVILIDFQILLDIPTAIEIEMVIEETLKENRLINLSLFSCLNCAKFKP